MKELATQISGFSFEFHNIYPPSPLYLIYPLYRDQKHTLSTFLVFGMLILSDLASTFFTFAFFETDHDPLLPSGDSSSCSALFLIDLFLFFIYFVLTSPVSLPSTFFLPYSFLLVYSSFIYFSLSRLHYLIQHHLTLSP